MRKLPFTIVWVMMNKLGDMNQVQNIENEHDEIISCQKILKRGNVWAESCSAGGKERGPWIYGLSLLYTQVCSSMMYGQTLLTGGQGRRAWTLLS